MKKETIGLLIIFGGIGLLAYTYFGRNKPKVDQKQLDLLNQGSKQLVDMSIDNGSDYVYQAPANWNADPNNIDYMNAPADLGIGKIGAIDWSNLDLLDSFTINKPLT